MIIVGKHIDDITLNDLEYLLEGGPGSDIKKFQSREQAETFLMEKGFTKEDLYFLVFQEV